MGLTRSRRSRFSIPGLRQPCGVQVTSLTASSDTYYILFAQQTQALISVARKFGGAIRQTINPFAKTTPHFMVSILQIR